MWHRGDRAKVRDLYDLWAVATMEPAALPAALPHMAGNAKAFLDAFTAPTELQRLDFAEIDAIGERPTLDLCITTAREILEPLIAGVPLVDPRA